MGCVWQCVAGLGNRGVYLAVTFGVVIVGCAWLYPVVLCKCGVYLSVYIWDV